jgi:hypothetical protein
MALPTGPQWTLQVLEDILAVCRLGPAAAIPPTATTGGFYSITRTADELSLVCRQDAVPPGVRCEPGWRGVRVAGTIPFTAIGVLAGLTAPLADAGISVFALSTFDTDYLLVKEQDLGAAVEVWRRQGHTVQGTPR